MGRLPPKSACLRHPRGSFKGFLLEGSPNGDYKGVVRGHNLLPILFLRVPFKGSVRAIRRIYYRGFDNHLYFFFFLGGGRPVFKPNYSIMLMIKRSRLRGVLAVWGFGGLGFGFRV